MVLRLATLLLALVFAGPSHADARDELHGAFIKNLALKSYRATMSELPANKQMMTMEFKAPDSFRITVAGQPAQVIVGGTMYMNTGGHTMKIPLPKGTLDKYRNQEALANLEKGVTVESLGPGRVGAEVARKYRFTTGGKHPSSSTAWIGVRNGHVLQVETSGNSAGKAYAMRVVYSDFNSPSIRISPPN